MSFIWRYNMLELLVSLVFVKQYGIIHYFKKLIIIRDFEQTTKINLFLL